MSIKTELIYGWLELVSKSAICGARTSFDMVPPFPGMPFVVSAAEEKPFHCIFVGKFILWSLSHSKARRKMPIMFVSVAQSLNWTKWGEKSYIKVSEW